MIFKIVHADEWHAARSASAYSGSAKDRQDGFLHFSAEAQLLSTLMRYYARADDLILVAVDETTLGTALKYEPSTGGALYPHLYEDLPLSAVKWSRPITRDKDGKFILPALT